MTLAGGLGPGPRPRGGGRSSPASSAAGSSSLPPSGRPTCRPMRTLTAAAGPFERLVIVGVDAGPRCWGSRPRSPRAGRSSGRSRAARSTGCSWRCSSTCRCLPLIPLVFVPRGRVFEATLAEATARGVVTPELAAAWRDPVVRAAHWYELVGGDGDPRRSCSPSRSERRGAGERRRAGRPTRRGPRRPPRPAGAARPARRRRRPGRRPRGGGPLPRGPAALRRARSAAGSRDAGYRTGPRRGRHRAAAGPRHARRRGVRPGLGGVARPGTSARRAGPARRAAPQGRRARGRRGGPGDPRGDRGGGLRR